MIYCTRIKVSKHLREKPSMKSRSKFLILCASLVLSLTTACQSAPAPSQSQAAASATAGKQVRDSGTHYVADAMKPYIESGECPGAISILYRDGVQETALLGYADMEKQIPIRMDQLFMQCSQTKVFCGVTIAILVEEGKLSLDDPVSKYLPEFKDLKIAVKGDDGKTVLVPAKNTLTVRMVMNHTGGFPFEIPTKARKGWTAVSVRDAAKEAASLPLQFEPGTKAQYSNTGFDIGAAVVEVITGQTWDAFLSERVLKPLGMTSTTFNPTDEQLKNIIQLYSITPGKKAELREFSPSMPLPHNGPTVHPSGAGLWTTAEDQYKFYKMLMNLGVGDNGVRILKEETVKSLLATNSRPAGLGSYSLGLWVFGSSVFGHGGAWDTSASVNWKKRHLSIWIVQQLGARNQFSWKTPLSKAKEQFFSAKNEAESAADAYTGRTK